LRAEGTSLGKIAAKAGIPKASMHRYLTGEPVGSDGHGRKILGPGDMTEVSGPPGLPSSTVPNSGADRRLGAGK
jgi:hypothetical protein